MENKKAVVLFSGGLDSTTTLYHAIQSGYEVHAITFDYSQKHSIELTRAREIAKMANLQRHVVVKLDPVLFSSSALTSDIEVPKNRENLNDEIIPVTYVPARNLIFLSMASGYAESNEINHIFIGVNSVDYSGYPDCRPDFIESFQTTADLGTKQGREGGGVRVHTPLIRKTKAEIIHIAFELNVPLELTWSCYDPVQDENGKEIPCEKCDSCLIRNRAFELFQQSREKNNPA